MTYLVRKIYHYTEHVEVVAESDSEAKHIATHTEGDRNADDHLHDCEVIRMWPTKAEEE